MPALVENPVLSIWPIKRTTSVEIQWEVVQRLQSRCHLASRNMILVNQNVDYDYAAYLHGIGMHTIVT